MFDRNAGTLHLWFFITSVVSLLGPALGNWVFAAVLLWKKNEADRYFESYFYTFLLSSLNGLIVGLKLVPKI